MTNTFDYDLIIIGSGPGGHTAALKASEKGLKTAVIESRAFGGVCLNSGCIPTKSLIDTAENIFRISRLEESGISVDIKNIDFEKVFKKKDTAVNNLKKGLEFLFKKNKIDIISGTGRINDINEVIINNETKISSRNIIIATGSSPVTIPGIIPDNKAVLYSYNLLENNSIPEKLTILGGGAVGLEMAYIYKAFGSDIHIIEMQDQLLPDEDYEVVSVLTRSLKKLGIKISTSTKITGVNKKDSGIDFTIENTKNNSTAHMITDSLLVSAGRKPDITDIGIEEMGIAVKNNFIDVNEYYQTNIKNIYAVGDVINSPMLAHAAAMEGEMAVEYIVNNKVSKIDHGLIPRAVYTKPQLAGFGYTEQQLISENIKYRKVLKHYRSNGKAVAANNIDGLLKILVCDKTQVILGAHITGEQATEIIHELIVARKTSLRAKDLASIVHAHPTYSEIIMEALKQA
ncbi:MAG: dihydrolipoyl dehydrogenase [bacterium]|nr:dihydrolipoyl dehydrogenase [bacterium]